jgi:hypothetical protein
MNYLREIGEAMPCWGWLIIYGTIFYVGVVRPWMNAEPAWCKYCGSTLNHDGVCPDGCDEVKAPPSVDPNTSAVTEGAPFWHMFHQCPHIEPGHRVWNPSDGQRLGQGNWCRWCLDKMKPTGPSAPL